MEFLIGAPKRKLVQFKDRYRRPEEKRVTKAEFYRNRGEKYRKTGKFSLAIEDLNKALRIHPNDPVALASRGEAKRQLNLFEEALIDLDKALLLDPHDVFALESRAETKKEMNLLQSALEDLNNAIKLHPNNSSALASRGSVHMKMKNYEDALSDLNHALELDPCDIFASENHGRLSKFLVESEDQVEPQGRLSRYLEEYESTMNSKKKTQREMPSYRKAIADLEEIERYGVDIEDDTRMKQSNFTQNLPSKSQNQKKTSANPQSKKPSISTLPSNIIDWTVEDVCNWLDKVKLSNLRDIFSEHQINGIALLELTEEDIKQDLKITLTGPRKQLLKEMRDLQKTSNDSTNQKIRPPNSPGPKSLLQEIPYEDLAFIEERGRGSFGIVWRGMLHGREVAVKIPQVINLHEFLHEAFLMERFHHKNIVEMIGVSFNLPRNICIITEWIDMGSLDGLLRKKDFGTFELLRFSMAIACGMEELHKQNIVHRDLACRNILCKSSDNPKEPIILKISDFGMSRIGFHEKNQTKTFEIPFLWTAPEGLADTPVYFLASDVWSWGVTIVEMFRKGKHPYPTQKKKGMSDGEIAMLVRNEGLHPEIPRGCPEELGSLLLDCWRYEPEQRPSFVKICTELDFILSNFHEKCVFADEK